MCKLSAPKSVLMHQSRRIYQLLEACHKIVFLEKLLAQLGKLWGADLKIAKLNLALSGQNLAHIRALLQGQAVPKTAVVNFLRNIMLEVRYMGPDFDRHNKSLS